MEKVCLYILVTIVCALAGYAIVNYFIIDNVAPFVSNYDNKSYSVRKEGDTQQAANYLSMINENINKVVDHIQKNNVPDPDTAKRLYSRWNKCVLKETSSSEKSAAYTLNKCSEIRLCIRTTDGKFEDMNTSMFVVLHELAHVMSISYGHGDEFKEHFSFIVHLASKLGIYNPEDFRRSPKTYCGVQINSSPCEDGSCKRN
jgi:hypothetical protein